MWTVKACFVSSSGGHWEELMCLKEIAREHDSFFVTEQSAQVADSREGRIIALPQINRHEKGFLWHFIKLFVKAFAITAREKPDVVITTGALIAFPFCVAAKCRKAKIVYIESFARVNSKSLTGRLVYPMADLFLVQWESLLKVYPRAKYVGCIF